MAASDSETDEIDENAIHDVEARADLLESVYIYITEGKYQEGLSANQKRVIRKKAVNSRIVKEEMIFIKKRRGIHMHYNLATYALQPSYMSCKYLAIIMIYACME